MNNEPKKLVAARAALREAEQDLANPQTLDCLNRGIDLLGEVILGEYLPIHRNIASQLAAAYRKKVIARVKVILSETDSYDLDSLEHWRNVMDTFSGLGDDAELRSCKEQLDTKWGLRLLQAMKPWEIESLKKELPRRK